jgi:DNA helicase-2/ATP-dependent DNA helicase PcrA
MYDDAHFRAADIAQLEQIAGRYESRERFLTELTLDPPDATSGRARANTLDEDYTILSTIHSAKGQEWRVVRILNVVDGCIPSDMATRTPEEIEEERRLLYVAMTRAKDELDLIVPQRFYTLQQSKLGDRHVYACRSRFIPDSILGSFERRSWRENTQAARRPAKQSGSTTDVAASLRRRWR